MKSIDELRADRDKALADIADTRVDLAKAITQEIL